jgi:hypothetical protein
VTITVLLSGGASNASQASSYGGAKSSIAAPKQIFGQFDPDLFTSGTVRYRCVYVQTSLALDDLKAWIHSETPSTATTVAMGWGAASINATESATANETTAPAGVTFASPSTEAAGINGGDFGDGDSRALWLRYTITPTTAKAIEVFSLGFNGVNQPSIVTLQGSPVTLNGQTVQLRVE